MKSRQGLALGKVAAYCGVTRKTILRWINDGLLQSYTLPRGHHRVLPQEAARFMRAGGMPVPPELERYAHHAALVVYGEEPTRQLVGELLRPHYAVSSTSSAIEACFRIGKQPPELVLFDVHMEGIDGVEFCRTLRRLPELQHVAIVILTSKMSSYLKNRLEGLIDGVLLKPFSPAALVKTCQSAVDARRR